MSSLTLRATQSLTAMPLTFADQLTLGQELVPASVLDIVEAGQERVAEATQDKDAAMLKLIRAQQEMIARLTKENTTKEMALAVAKSQTAESEVAHYAEVVALKELAKTSQARFEEQEMQHQTEVAALKTLVANLETQAVEKAAALKKNWAVAKRL